MKWKITKHNALDLASAVVLFIGLASSALIYLGTDDASDNALVNEYEMSKMYRHDLELFGGTANVLAVEFTEWLRGLWHGRQLAFTVAGIAVLVAACLFVFARLLRTEDSTGDGR